MVGQSEIDQIREAADLVALVGEHVPLRPRGREHVGLCPFHDDHAPSLSVVTHKGNAFYKCHACGAAGDVFRFVMEYHKMSFGEALRYLAERTGITLRRGPDDDRRGAGHADLRRANALAAQFFRDTLTGSPRGAAARALIADRGISDAMSERFMLGAAPDEWEAFREFAAGRGVGAETLAAAGLVKPRAEDRGHYDAFRGRLIFPIRDELGRPVAFGGRHLDPQETPKYLNSAESPIFQKRRTLYGLHEAKRAVIESGRVIVTEGYTDVVACHQAGFENVVATLGTALTADHVRALKRLCHEVILVFDGDEAGQAAADRAVELFFVESVDTRICVLPDGLDPADLLGAGDGRERLAAAIDSARDALAFKVGRFQAELAAAGGPAARHACLVRLLESLAQLGFESMPGVRRRPVIAHLAELLDVRIGDIEEAMRLPTPRGQTAAAGPADDRAAPDLWAGDEAGPPAVRRAERELLGLLICEPSLRRQPVASDTTVAGLLRPEVFVDPAARRIAEVVWRWLDGDSSFTVQQLMGELEEPRLRTLAGELYVEAEARLGLEKGEAVEHLRELWAALERLRRREQYRRDLDAFKRGGPPREGADALAAVIDERRKQGYIPEAIPSRVRT